MKYDPLIQKHASEADVRAALANYKIDQQLGVDWIKPYGILVFKLHTHPSYFVMLRRPTRKVHFELRAYHGWYAFSNKWRYVRITVGTPPNDYVVEIDPYGTINDNPWSTDLVDGIVIRGTQVREMEF